MVIPLAVCLVTSLPAKDVLRYFGWLVGSWSSDSESGETIERWQRVDEGLLKGFGYARKRAAEEAQLTETLFLIETQGEVFYLAKVAHNPLPVAFKLTNRTENRLVFENPEHDFPKRIVYHRTGDNALTVRVDDGDSKGFSIEFTRMQSDED